MSEVVVAFPRPDPSAANDDYGQLIQLYLETRNVKQELEKKHKDHVRQYNDVMKKIEAKLFEHLQAHNMQSISSDEGTAYISHKRSASIGDAEAFKNFVIESRAWDMLDWKANVTAVGDFIEENDVPPPGVNFRTEQSLNIMKK